MSSEVYKEGNFQGEKGEDESYLWSSDVSALRREVRDENSLFQETLRSLFVTFSCLFGFLKNFNNCFWFS